MFVCLIIAGGLCLFFFYLKNLQPTDSAPNFSFPTINTSATPAPDPYFIINGTTVYLIPPTSTATQSAGLLGFSLPFQTAAVNQLTASPTQTLFASENLVSTCSNSKVVQPGDTCFDLWTSAGLTEQAFIAANPTLKCNPLAVGTTVCLSTVGASKSNVVVGNGGQLHVGDLSESSLDPTNDTSVSNGGSINAYNEVSHGGNGHSFQPQVYKSNSIVENKLNSPSNSSDSNPSNLESSVISAVTIPIDLSPPSRRGFRIVSATGQCARWSPAQGGILILETCAISASDAVAEVFDVVPGKVTGEVGLKELRSGFCLEAGNANWVIIIIDLKHFFLITR